MPRLEVSFTYAPTINGLKVIYYPVDASGQANSEWFGTWEVPRSAPSKDPAVTRLVERVDLLFGLLPKFLEVKSVETPDGAVRPTPEVEEMTLNTWQPTLRVARTLHSQDREFIRHGYATIGFSVLTADVLRLVEDIRVSVVAESWRELRRQLGMTEAEPRPPREGAVQALTLASHKLPIKTKITARPDYEGAAKQ